MYLGQIVEKCPSKELFRQPLHPYTQALISAVPTADIHRKKERIILEGEITSPINPKPHCRFARRCKYECKPCHEPQRLEEVLPNHFVACCRVREINTF
jgi:peptide/nickel transport system ATP-binding protein